MSSSASVAPAPEGLSEDSAADPPKTGATPELERVARAPFWHLSRAAVGTLVAGLAVTLALSLTALALYERNESRLLKLNGRELGLVLQGVIPSLQTPLASAAELADATNGDARKFRAFMAPLVGPKGQFASASLWALGTANPTPKTVLGSPPVLASHPAQARSFFARAAHASALQVVGILKSPVPSLGYAFSAPGPHGGFAAYAETPLPASKRSSVASTAPFSNLNYAFYLGRSRNRSDLLVTNIQHFPIQGRKTVDVVPFGDSALTVVVTPHGSLGGTFFESLPWIIGILGTMITIAATALSERLVRRRRYAEALAGDLDRAAAENRRLYTEQRGIAQTLQHALLPDALPVLEGLRATARYVPAGHGVDVGGDWYDVHALDEQRALLIIGDVSGHGLGAATTMASLRHAALAYAVEGYRPGEVLEKLADFVGDGAKRHFATVMCALIERDRHRVSVASAGHLPPLIIDGAQASYLEFSVGPPIGVAHGSQYAESTADVAPHAIFLAYTDGLVERRGELLDVGLERLRKAAVRDRLPVEELLGTLTEELSSPQDDTAAVGIEWQT